MNWYKTKIFQGETDQISNLQLKKKEKRTASFFYEKIGCEVYFVRYYFI